jgi:hypothetical protein
MVEEETNQLCLVLWILLEYGIVRYSTLLHLILSSFINYYFPSILLCLYQSPHKCVNGFAFLVRTLVEEETNQLCLVVRLQLEYGIVRSSISLHLILSSFTNYYFPSILLCLYQSPHKCVNGFAFLVRTLVEEETNQLCLVVRLQLEYGIVRSSISPHLFLSRFTNSYLPSICCAFPTPQYWCQWNMSGKPTSTWTTYSQTSEYLYTYTLTCSARQQGVALFEMIFTSRVRVTVYKNGHWSKVTR